nr:hypothetical protein [Tanacetum cinerariifolium]
MEEMLYKSIDEGKREHEEMMAFICEFQTTNEIVFKERNKLLRIDSLFETTPQMDVPASTTVAPLTLTAPTLTPPTIPTISRFAGAISSIHKIVQRYMDQQMNETVKVAAQIQSDRLRDEAQAEKEEFLKNLDENIQKIIKEQVKEQVKGIDCLPNEEIFTELARMRYEKPSTKLTFYKAFFSCQWKFLIHTILQCAASIADDDVLTADDKPSISSPTPPTQPPPPSQDIPSTSQVQLTPPSLVAQPPSPQQQP